MQTFHVTLFFFFNVPSHPQINPDYHPLSLHDALPIFTHANHFRASGCAQQSGLQLCQRHHPRTAERPGCYLSGQRRYAHVADVAAPGRSQRSEEHTSELQSLMRISYAVFCLKKKQINILSRREETQTSRTTQMK